MDKLETWISNSKSKLRKIDCSLELDICLIRYYECIIDSFGENPKEKEENKKIIEKKTKIGDDKYTKTENEKENTSINKNEGKLSNEKERKKKRLLIFLQEKIKPLTSDDEILFNCSKMIIRKPQRAEIDSKHSILLKKITQTFYRVFFIVEGYNRNFVLESVLSVSLKSWGSKHVRAKDVVPFKSANLLQKSQLIRKNLQFLRYLTKSIFHAKYFYSNTLNNYKNYYLFLLLN